VSPGSPEQSSIPGLSIPRLIALHLAPGVLATLLFVLIASPVEAAGYPPALAFVVAMLAIVVPWELGFVLWAGRRAGGGWLAAIPYREPLSPREWVTLLPSLLAVSLVGFLALSLLEPGILDALFGWLPSWFVDPWPLDDAAEYSSGAWTVTLIAYAATNVFVGPAVEELYFRGYLLPRMSRLGR
jgi:hypothetical protein